MKPPTIDSPPRWTTTDTFGLMLLLIFLSGFLAGCGERVTSEEIQRAKARCVQAVCDGYRFGR